MCSWAEELCNMWASSQVRDVPTRAGEAQVQGVWWISNMPTWAGKERVQGVRRVGDMPTRAGEAQVQGLRWVGDVLTRAGDRGSRAGRAFPVSCMDLPTWAAQE